MNHKHYRRMMSDSIDDISSLNSDSQENSSRSIYMSYDGDGIGRMVGQAILHDDVNLLSEYSHKIEAGNELVNNWVRSIGGIQYSSGGDQGAYSIPEDAVQDLEAIKKDYEFTVGASATFGIGNSLSESGKALIAGKLTGKNKIVQYSEEVENILQETKEKLNQGQGNDQDKKMGESYLDSALKENMEHKEDCPYCKEMDGENKEEISHDDCPYCKEMDSGSEDASHDDCPYCKEMDGKESDADSCPHCNEYDAKQSQSEPTDGPDTENPTTQDSENFAGQDLDDPSIPKPDPKDAVMDQAPIMDDSTTNNAMLEQQGQQQAEAAPISEASNDEETPESILEAMVAEGSNPNQENREQINENVDSTELPIGDNMEGNVSHTENYDDTSNAGDMGLSEDENQDPNLEQVIGEDLNSHADQIQKEKIVQMVSEALEGFKSCKDILEKAKEQAPQLYSSSIAMLRAMIEMSKLLELKGNAEAAPQAPQHEEQQYDTTVPDQASESGQEDPKP